MNTGCLNWNEFTAMVATRPRARRAASTPPAMSTWDMIHPPKMSPCWLASAGMGTTRSTGSLSSGSVTGSSVTPAGLLDDALQGGARVDRAGLQRLAQSPRGADLRQA